MGVMSVSYLTIDGEILSETRNGVGSDYIPIRLDRRFDPFKPNNYCYLLLVAVRRVAEPFWV